MKCPLCNYLMDAFDKECPRCHGKGLPQNAAPPPPSPPIQVAPPPSPYPVQQNIPSHYTRTCPHCQARMSALMEYCPVCHKSRNPARQTSGSGGLKAFLGVFMVLAVAGFFGYRHWLSTPQYSLLQIQQAVDTQNVGLFEKHVDVDEFVENYLDDGIALLSERDAAARKASNNKAAELGAALAEGLIKAIKPNLVSILKKQMIAFVESGEADSEDKSGFSPKSLARKLKEQEIVYDGLKSIEKDGHTAIASLGFKNKLEQDKSFTVDLKMRQMDGYWQVTKWENAKDVVQDLDLLPPAKTPAPSSDLQDALAPPSTQEGTTAPVPLENPALR